MDVGPRGKGAFSARFGILGKTDTPITRCIKILDNKKAAFFEIGCSRELTLIAYSM